MRVLVLLVSALLVVVGDPAALSRAGAAPPRPVLQDEATAAAELERDLDAALGEDRVAAALARRRLRELVRNHPELVVVRVRTPADDAARLAARLFGATAAPGQKDVFFGWLDHEDGDVARSGMMALFALHDPAVDARVLGRLAALRGEAAATDPLRLRKLGQVLTYASMRGMAGDLERLEEVFRTGPAELRAIAAQLLRRSHGAAFEAIARRALADAATGDAELTRAFADFILAEPRHGDRRLGLSLAELDASTRAAVETLVARDAAWLGIAPDLPGVRAFSYRLSLERTRPDKHIASDRSAAEADVDRALLRGITLELPLDDLVTRPYAYVASLRADDAGAELTFALRSGESMTASTGIGCEAFGLWYAREIVRAARAVLALDDAGRPRRLDLLDAADARLVRVVFDDWRDAEGRRWPATLRWEGAELELEASFVEALPGVANLDRARARRTGDAGDEAPTFAAEVDHRVIAPVREPDPGR